MKENNKNKKNQVIKWTYEYTLNSEIEEDLQSKEVLR